MSKTYDIQELIQASGVPRRTIYFYVQVGILPPPEGAGLAARYSEEHLLRLRLIPVLRQQGKRLDEIREHFAGMDADQMRQALNQARAVPQAARSAPSSVRPPSILPGAPAGWGESRYIHYALPAGVVIIAPETLSHTDRHRLDMLLQAARQIFSGHPLPVYLDSNQQPSPAPQDGEQGAKEE